MFLNSMEVAHPMHMVDPTIRCDRQAWNADDEEDHILRKGTGTLEQGGLNVGE